MRHGRVARVALLLALNAAHAPAHSAPPPAALPVPRPFGVAVETGKRTMARGDRVAYDLYIPQAANGLPPPPWPAVVLDHGFARSKVRHANTSRFLAERGVVVLVANLVSLLGGERAQLANVESTRDHVAWLKARSASPGDPLFGLVDPERIALAGYSAGGAVAFEAAASGARVRAVVLLDAVPWERTIGAAKKVAVPRLLSLRSEPSACNSKGSVRKLLANLPFESDDVRIVGGTHCDAEDPTDAACRFFCGGSKDGARVLYRRLLYSFLRDALDAPPVGDVPDSWFEAIRRGVEDGSLVVDRVTPES
ncbi:MAG: dienelactone hydrolase family protein [Holophagales bacterium]|nr:dienelactone hydrolase family protein [Holophagales bacterium]